MTPRSLAYKNVVQSRGRYLAYLGSAAFAVTIYFLYTALALHPSLQGGYRAAEYVRIATTASASVIALFTFLFLLYSSAAFLRFRSKELGLLSLLGLTRLQLARIVLWENAIVAATAIAAGLSVGLLFLKLFFMAISAVLRLPEELPLYAGAKVFAQTIAVFAAFFLVVSVFSLRGVLKGNTVELLRAQRKPNAAPTFSRVRALVGCFLIGAGYAWASSSNPLAVIAGVVPVTIMVSIGTYFVMREGSIALLNKARQREQLFYRPRPFLLISQLVFKMQENYRVLSAVALLVAVIVSAVGAVYSVYGVVGSDAVTMAPQPVQLALDGGDPEREAAVVEELLARHGAPRLERVRISSLVGRLGEEEVRVVARSLYERLHRPQGAPIPVEREDQAVLVFPFALPERLRTALSPQAIEVLHLGSTELPLEVLPDSSGRLFNGRVGGVKSLVVSDALFAALREKHPEVEADPLWVWTGSEWRGRGLESAIRALETRYDGVTGAELTTTLGEYHAMSGDFGLALFNGIFVSLVFFAAACSLLYFRLFTEIHEDRRYFRRLQEVGVAGDELRRIAAIQNAVLFLIPFLVGLAHSTFAMKALDTLVTSFSRTWWSGTIANGWRVASAYFIAYLAYFSATHGLYRRSLGEDLSKSY